MSGQETLSRETSVSRIGSAGHASIEAPTASQLSAALHFIAEYLTEHAADDQELRDAVSKLARFALKATNGSAETGNADTAPPASRVVKTSLGKQFRIDTGHSFGSPSNDVRSENSSQFAEPESRSKELREPAIKPRYSDVTDSDLTLIIDRCRLKAEGSRWAVDRDERLREGADFASEIRPGDMDIIDRARSMPNCFLWMNQPRSDIWTRADDYLLISDCFDALSDAVESLQAIMDSTSDDKELFLKAVNLVAEAQSGLRAAVAVVESHPDSDQQMIYHWLRNRASRDRFYIARHMKISDPADPEGCDDIFDKAQELHEALAMSLKRQAHRDVLLAELRAETAALGDGPQADPSVWDSVLAKIDQLVVLGMPITSPTLRDVLIPVVGSLPETAFTDNVKDILAQIDDFLADESDPNQTAASREHTSQTDEVASLLAGRTVALIGGTLRQAVKQEITSAFSLRELEWIEATAERISSSMESKIGRPDLAVILFAPHWASVSKDEVLQQCASHAQVVVQISPDYDVEQIAAAILLRREELIPENDARHLID
jgi:hypothetical protein